MTFPQTTASNTPEPYMFQLTSRLNGQTIVCDPAPIEWESGTLEMNRDLSLGGVFATFALSSLTFIGNGAAMLNDLFNAYELNAECTLVVYWWQRSTRSYVEFPSRFDINFNVYEKVKIGKFTFGVRVKAINSSIQTKLDSREDIEVDLTKLVTIGGLVLTDYFPLKKRLNYDATNVQNYAHLYETSRVGWDLPRKPGEISYTSCPLTLHENDFIECQSVPYITQSNNLTAIVSFFKSARFDYTFSLKYNFVIDVVSDNVNDQWEIRLLETKEIVGLINSTVTENDTLLGSFGSAATPLLIITGVIEEVTISKGNDFKLAIRVANTNSLKALLKSSEITLTQSIAQSPAKLTEGFPLYEALERNCQHILDSQFPIYSEFFGRTDTPYNSAGTCYASENQLRFAHIQSGLNQRGQSLNDPLAINFKDLESSIRKIYNTGYSFINVGGVLRIRIEEYAFFFQNTMVLDISDRINKYDIQSQVMPELVPVGIKSGFDSYEYLQLNGRSEPNTTNQRTSIMNTSAKFDIVSKLRGDTKGILDNLSNPIDMTGTTDNKGDNDIFIIKTQRDETYDWKPEKAENVTIDNDTSIFKTDLLNRLYTPSRILKRHGNRIKSGMMRYASSVLRFQKSDKLQTLETTGEGYSIAENSDIPVSTLAAPIYKPMKHMVECSFNFADLAAIQGNPLGYIKLSDTISGYLLSLKKKNNEAMAEITIIEKY